MFTNFLLDKIKQVSYRCHTHLNIFFIQTKSKPHGSIYHAKFCKYAKFHKNPLQTHEKICGPKLDSFCKENVSSVGENRCFGAHLSRYGVTRGFVTLQYQLYKVLVETRASRQYGGVLETLHTRYSTV